MQITELTREEVENWKKVFKNHKLKSNRISGEELDSYFRNKYKVTLIENDEFSEVFKFNLFENIPDYEDKYKQEPSIRTYIIENNVYVGIDTVSGFFSVEAKCIDLCVPIYDDLFLKRGLDEEDLKNYFLVYQYATLKDKEK